MSDSDEAYRRRREVPCRAQPGLVGHLGYELTADGGLRELGPGPCPCGDRWLVGWDGQHRYYLCRGCGAEWLFCTCRGSLFAYEGRTERVECELA